MIKNRIFLVPTFLILLCVSVNVFPSELVLKSNDGRRIIAFDKDGNIFTDSGAHSIASYTKKGAFTRKFGQKGEGPGDIKRMSCFDINPGNNTIYVTEFVHGNRWISMFSTKGKYLGEWSCEIDWPGISGLSNIEFDNSGNVYIQILKFIYRRNKDFSIGSVKNTITKFSPEGKKIKEMYELTYDFNAEKGGKGNVTIPFSNYLYWTIHNDKLYVRESILDYINVYNLDGTPDKKLPLPFEMQKVTEIDLDEWQDWMKTLPFVKKGTSQGYFDLNYWRKRLPFPEYKPISGSLIFIDADGFLYSNKYTSHQSNKNIWARIDIETANSTVISIDPNDKIMAIRDNYFFIRKLDEEEKNILIKTKSKDYLNGRVLNNAEQ